MTSSMTVVHQERPLKTWKRVCAKTIVPIENKRSGSSRVLREWQEVKACENVSRDKSEVVSWIKYFATTF